MRKDNIAMLKETLDILERGYYFADGRRVSLKLNKEQMREAYVYLPDDVRRICEAKDFPHVHAEGRCEYSCRNVDSFSLARKRQEELAHGTVSEAGKGAGGTEPVGGPVAAGKPVLVLNLANPVHPGGGVRKGATAQEEDLCRKSSLLLSVEGEAAAPYYAYNRKLDTFMGSDAVIIHPQVEIIRDENGKLLEDSVVVAVLTCAAPMVKRGLEGMTEEQYEAMLLQRITGMLKAAAYCGYEHLILGAFGCGAFGNDAHIVSGLFFRALHEFDYDGMKENDVFRSIDFAVLDTTESQYNYREFWRNFHDFYREDEKREAARVLEERKYICMHRAGARPAVFFWKDTEENGYLSNWYRRKFVIDDFEYQHVEQYMMAQKAKLFHDAERYTAILRADTPRQCKKLGQQVAPFDAKAWDAVKFDVVKAGNRAKFEQNPDLMKRLLETGDAVLAEASPKDVIWGIGLDAAAAASVDMEDWPGQGLLGKVLMELRGEFRAESGGQVR